jgi:hypothetical protein
MQQQDLCQRCLQEPTQPIWKSVYINHDFDATGQEFDPIWVGYDIAGFELHCPTCNYELYELRKAEKEADDLPC